MRTFEFFVRIALYKFNVCRDKLHPIIWASDSPRKQKTIDSINIFGL